VVGAAVIALAAFSWVGFSDRGGGQTSAAEMPPTRVTVSKPGPNTGWFRGNIKPLSARIFSTVSVIQREAQLQPDRMLDDQRLKTVVVVGDFGHLRGPAPTQPPQEPPLEQSVSSRSVLAGRCSRDPATLEGWIAKARWVDLNGDRRPDIVVTKGDHFT
jgi:hypothetical protein